MGSSLMRMMRTETSWIGRPTHMPNPWALRAAVSERISLLPNEETGMASVAP
jgi:hypothetical protein